VIRPEISRTYHFGTEGGASLNQFGNMMKHVILNDEPVNWEAEDLSYLESPVYERDYEALVMGSQLASTLAEALKLLETGNVRLGYEDFAEFHRYAGSLRIMDDEKAMIPRTAYKGIVETRPEGDNLLFLYPKHG
jgi:alpha-1,3-mannosyl-glycoprotein beta-1,2-N-acetylglucosaminyltransferase